MFDPPKIGTSHSRTFRVDREHCIDFEGISVLSTPHLIWELEHAALELLQASLDSTQISLGVFLELEHRAPAVAGDEVVASARVVHRDGPLVTFQIVANSDDECLAQGLHKRRVVNRQKLLGRLKARSSSNSNQADRS